MLARKAPRIGGYLAGEGGKLNERYEKGPTSRALLTIVG